MPYPEYKPENHPYAEYESEWFPISDSPTQSGYYKLRFKIVSEFWGYSPHFWYYDVETDDWYYDDSLACKATPFIAEIVEWCGLSGDFSIRETTIKAGSIVRILKSRSDDIPEIKQMIGKECKVLDVSEKDVEVLQEDEKDFWFFMYDEVELVKE